MEEAGIVTKRAGWAKSLAAVIYFPPDDSIPSHRLSNHRHRKHRGFDMIFALCLDNEGYEASLELRKLYPVLPPESNDPPGYIRVIDESGDDYLYTAAAFEVIELPLQLEQRIVASLK